MSESVRDRSPGANRAPQERAVHVKTLRRHVGERQLRACLSLLRGISKLLERQRSLSQGQTLVREEAVRETDTLRQMCSEMQEAAKQQSRLDCWEHLQHSLSAIGRVLGGGSLSDDVEICVTLSKAVNALLKRQLLLNEGHCVRRQEIDQLMQVGAQLVSGLQELTGQHADFQVVSTPACDVMSSSDARVAAPPRRKSILKDIRAKSEDPQLSLIPSAGQVITGKEIVMVKRETETFRPIVPQVLEATSNRAVLQDSGNIQTDIRERGKGDEFVSLTVATEETPTKTAGAAVTAGNVRSQYSQAVAVTDLGSVPGHGNGLAVSENVNKGNHWQSVLCRPPKTNELLQLSTLIAEQWKEVARCLHPHPFESGDIANFEYEHSQSLTDQGTVMLEQWRKMHGREATVRLLCQSLLDAECKLAAEKVFGEEVAERAAADIVECSQKLPESAEHRLFDLAKRVGTEWRALALQLDVHPMDVDCIERDIRTTRERAFKMLLDWYRKHGRRSNFDEVSRKIIEILKEKQVRESAGVIFPNNLPDDQRFYGREHELRAMEECFLGEDVRFLSASKLSLLVIRGHGGVGKSLLAARFAVMFKDAYSDGVFLFNTDSWPTLHMSVKENIVKLGAPGTEGGLDEDNNRFFSFLREKSRVLLLYDNADDLNLVTRVLPRESSQFHVVVTTRCAVDHALLARASQVISLDYLSPENAVDALFGWADRRRPDDGDELEYAKRMVTSRLIQGLPIAIAHIGTFVRLARMSFQDYYELLKSHEEELKAAALDIDKLLRYFRISYLRGPLAAVGVTQPHQLQALSYEKLNDVTNKQADKQVIVSAQSWMTESSHVYLTWQMDIDSVGEKSPDALRVIEYAALLASKNIPGFILKEMAFPGRGRRAAYQFSLAVMELSSHTLITTVETNEGYRSDVHSLVQSAVFQRLIRRPDNLYIKLTCLAEFLLQNMPANIRRSLNFSGFLQLISHIYSVAEKILITGCQNDVCFDLVEKACTSALEAHHVDVARDLCAKQLDMVESVCRNSSDLDNIQRHVTALLQMGRSCLVLQQKPADAENYYTRALELINSLSDDGSLCIQLQLEKASVLGDLANCYQGQHQFDRAKQFHLDRLSLVKSSPHADSRDVVAAMNDLASFYYKSGQFRYAISQYQETLCKADYVEELDIDVINVMYNLGSCLMNVGDYGAAAETLERSLTLMRQWRPGDHHDVAQVLRVLSHCYESCGDLAKASTLSEEALSIIRTTHDPLHPTVAVFIGRVAACKHSARDVDKAISLRKQSVEILRRNQPEAREQLSTALNDLGNCYYTKNMLKMAISALEESLTLRLSFLPKLHPRVAAAFCNLGSAYEKAGDVRKAMELYRESLSICEHVPVVHVGTAEVLNKLTSCLFQQKQFTECSQLLLRLREVLSQVGPAPERMAATLNKLAMCYESENKLWEAITTFEDCLTLQQSFLPKLHADVAATLSSLGAAYQKAGNVDMAMGLYRESLSIREHVLPAHVDTADVFSVLATCLFQRGQVTESLPLFVRSRDILAQVSPVSEKMGTVLNNLGVCYDTKNMLKEAISTLEECLSLRQKLLPKLHPLVAATLYKLGKFYQKAGDVNRALELYRESLYIREHILPVDVGTADVLNKLAVCLLQQGQVEESLEMGLRSRDILAKVSPMSEMMSTAWFYLGACYVKMSRLREAEEAYSESMKISSAVCPPGHSLIIQAEKILHRLRQGMLGY